MIDGFGHINRIYVPQRLVTAAHDHLRALGARGFEALALWAGTLEGTDFYVRHTLVPKQRCTRSSSGVGVSVPPDELHRVSVWLFENQLRVIGQLHSHPGEAYHSETDDAFPLATTIGCVSIVVPDFAAAQFLLSRCAVYRLDRRGKWLELLPEESSGLIQIVATPGVAPLGGSA
ncbi:MAG: Mov34/MPN/PAD-1 family protein [Nitrospira sp.]|nr:Mov34/MPN/PAD-1 family protein [Nitrospira sp.]